MGASKATKENRLLQGLCNRCGKVPYRQGNKTCESCFQKLRNYGKGDRQKRKELGLCQKCPNQVVDNHVYCEKHMLHNRSQSKKITTTRINNGLCALCGNEREPNFKRLCSNCFNKAKESQRQEYVERQVNGICVYCGKSQSLQEVNSCEDCFFKNLSANHFGSRKRYQELIDLFYSQQSLCAVTKMALILGNTASLDHIIPLSKGGTHDIDNLRFVHVWINVMKMNDLDEVFIPKLKNWFNTTKELLVNHDT
jgi:ribosomal protein L37E